jgi:hypothetical protein
MFIVVQMNADAPKLCASYWPAIRNGSVAGSDPILVHDSPRVIGAASEA